MNFKKVALVISLLASGILADRLSVFASTITIIDPPGSTDTEVRSINSNGEVAGFYVNSSGHKVGFTYLNGKFTTIKVPGSTNTYIISINDNGEVAGEYENSSGDQGGGFT